jgi:hypothetical protein
MNESEEYKPIQINQDTEWCIKNIQAYMLLRPGPKSLQILSYDGVWDSNNSDFSKYQLRVEESDPGYSETTTKVDFDFVKMYLFCGFLRYTRPIIDSTVRGVEIQHISLLGTTKYLYLFQERSDVWPPVVIPTEFNPSYNANLGINSILGSKNGQKGLKIDTISQFDSILGVGRIEDVCHIQRWQTYKIDDAVKEYESTQAAEYEGLGRALQNGHIGYYSPFESHNTPIERKFQQGTLSGWIYWIRIIFGRHESKNTLGNLRPNTCPKSIPNSNKDIEVWYWWDLVFTSRESADDFAHTILKMSNGSNRTGIQFVSGDD